MLTMRPSGVLLMVSRLSCGGFFITEQRCQEAVRDKRHHEDTDGAQAGTEIHR